MKKVAIKRARVRLPPIERGMRTNEEIADSLAELRRQLGLGPGDEIPDEYLVCETLPPTQENLDRAWANAEAVAARADRATRKWRKEGGRGRRCS